MTKGREGPHLLMIRQDNFPSLHGLGLQVPYQPTNRASLWNLRSILKNESQIQKLSLQRAIWRLSLRFRNKESPSTSKKRELHKSQAWERGPSWSPCASKQEQNIICSRSHDCKSLLFGQSPFTATLGSPSPSYPGAPYTLLYWWCCFGETPGGRGAGLGWMKPNGRSLFLSHDRDKTVTNMKHPLWVSAEPRHRIQRILCVGLGNTT